MKADRPHRHPILRIARITGIALFSASLLSGCATAYTHSDPTKTETDLAAVKLKCDLVSKHIAGPPPSGLTHTSATDLNVARVRWQMERHRAYDECMKSHGWSS